MAKQDSWVSLHTHSAFSMLDGAAKTDELVQAAVDYGMPGLAVTDHGNMYGAFEFYNACKAAGIKFIPGMEAYIAPGSRFEKRLPEGSAEKTDKYSHMTLLAVTTEGYENLVKISSLASLEGQYYKPRADRELLAEHASGIVATTGCVGGEVAQLIYRGRYDEAKRVAGEFAEIFGEGNFYVELMKHGIEIEEATYPGLIRLAKELNLPLLATNDLHYTHKKDAVAHDALLCIQTGATIDQEKRFRFEGDNFYLKSPAEMRELFSDHPEAVDNTLVICERADVTIESGKTLLPAFPVPEGQTSEAYLRERVEIGLQKRYKGDVPDEVKAQAEYETGVINQMGFPDYFLIVEDLIAHAKEVGIRVGPGRGSAAGAMIAYALGITELDPIEHGLVFERFLNPERVSMPDIDIDFDDRRRPEMIEYAVQKYGYDKVAQIVTYGTIKAKAALKDAARVLGFPYSTGDKLTKAMPAMVMGKDMPLRDCFDPKSPRYGEAGELREMYKTDPDAKTVIDTALGLEDLKRQVGVHAAGVIISDQPLINNVPVWKREADGAVVTQYDMGTCEKIGLLKMDFLGLRNLTIIEDALTGIRNNRGVDLVMEDLTLDDPATYKLLQDGDTVGVFQLESGPMRALMRSLRPTSFADISALIALYRPGPMGVNAHNDYADRKNGRKPVVPIHPEVAESLKDVLDETYSLVVYQEQIQRAAQVLAGYSLGQADLLRRAMGKKKKEILDKEYVPFRDGMRKNGYSDDAVKTVWDVFVPFADYAFNKAHSAAYGLISYWTAYLKANYPVEYMAALLTSVGDNKDKTALFLSECRKMGIKVLPPDVNVSDMGFTPTGDTIRFGLGAVRSVGEPVVQAIVAARTEKGEFTSFDDYVRKVDAAACKKNTVDALIKAGAFDSLGHSRRGLSLVYEQVIASGSKSKKAEAAGQFDLFSAMDDFVAPETEIPEGEWDQKTVLSFEREMLGLYVSAHPLDGVDLSHENTIPIPHLMSDELPDRGEVQIAGIISSVEHKLSKQGKPWAATVVEDLTGSVEVMFFSRSYLACKDQLVPDAVVVVTGTLDKRESDVKVLAAGVRPPRSAPAKGFDATDHSEMIVVLSTDQISPGLVAAIKTVLGEHQGELPVVVSTPGGKRFPVPMQVDGRLPLRLKLRELDGVGDVTFTTS